MLLSLPGGTTTFPGIDSIEPTEVCLPPSFLKGSCQVKPRKSTFSSGAKYSLPKLWSLAKMAFFGLPFCFLFPLVPSANVVLLSPESSPPFSSSSCCFRICGAFSRSAWLVFSLAFLSPTSSQFPVLSLCFKNLPGGHCPRHSRIISRATSGLSRRLLLTYLTFRSSTIVRYRLFPG